MDDSGGAGADEETIDELLHLIRAARHHDLARSAALLDRAEAPVAASRDVRLAAQLGELRGEVALASGDLPAAAAAFRHARLNWLAAGMRLGAARAALGGTATQLAQGEVEDAMGALTRVRESLAALHGVDEHERSALQAMAQRQIGEACAALGDISTAWRHFGVAEDLCRSLGDVAGVGLVNIGRGLAQLDLGLSHRALAEFSRGRAHLLEAGHVVAASTVPIHIAEGLLLTGQVARSLELLDIIRPGLETNRLAMAMLQVTRAHALLRAGLPAEAHAESQAAALVFSELGMVERAARAALASANGSRQLGQVDAARRELVTADLLFSECGSRLVRARTWILRAELALAAEDHGVASQFCREVLEVEAEVAPELGVEARLILARIEPERAANELLDEAESLVHDIGVPELRAEVTLGRARQLRRRGCGPETAEELRRALEIGHAWNLWATDGAGGRPTHTAMTEATDELIEVLLDQGDYDTRMEAWQRASVAKRESLVPLAERAPGWGAAKGPRRTEQRLEELISGGSEHRPVRHFPGRPGGLPPVPRAHVLDYYTAGDRVTAFVLHDGHVQVRRLGEIGAQVRRLMGAWHQECLLLAASRVPDQDLRSSATLDALHDLLVRPVADLLADLEDEIQVVGHRYLNALALDALLDGLHRDPQDTVDQFGPDVVHSADGAVSDSLAALVIAVPDEDAPFIHDEAEMIFKTLPSTEVLTGTGATRRRLAELAREADVIHFACHGVFRRGNPLMSALRLGDGWLTARDVLAGAVPAQDSLVVLSACGSGLSADHTSEPLGLAWAFLGAGATGVVATLWSVDDAATSLFMTHFYEAVADGWRPPAALRRARREVARVHPHPYYWAGYRYLGRDTVDQRAAGVVPTLLRELDATDEAI